MSLFNNAIASIQIGVQDYKVSDSKRYLSAVRNITAGILLLYKHKLHKLSPPNDDEAFIKKKLLPKKNDIGEIVFVGVGKKTVDVH